ncbi:uncharacterized protein VTP21DRAFT_1628 [Calcarisporiella thermophila]|uniref:uncharacterized protein n=1 Tax=Calcarisporiella thermophila TaxID=911321 RepID=UPI0037427E18
MILVLWVLFIIPILAQTSPIDLSRITLYDEPRTLDTHQLASYIANHYLEILETTFQKITGRVGAQFRESIQVNYTSTPPSLYPADEQPQQKQAHLDDRSQADFYDLDLDVFSKQVSGAVDTYVKDKIPLVLAASPLFASPLAQAIEEMLLARCTSSTHISQCLRTRANALVEEMDTHVAGHIKEIMKQLRTALPVMWGNVQHGVRQVVWEFHGGENGSRRVTATFRPLGLGFDELVDEAGALNDIKHRDGRMLQDMLTIAEGHL